MKKLIFLLVLCFCVGTVGVRPVETYAYTEEEKQMAKDWLSAHGYAPTRAGAEQAYQDYLNGKFDDLIKEYQGNSGQEEPDKEKPKKKKKEDNKTAEIPTETSTEASTEVSTEASTEVSTETTAEPATTSVENSTDEAVEDTIEQEENAGTDTESETEYEKAQKERNKKKWMSLGIIVAASLFVILGGFFLFFRKKD